ncbi:MAG: DUF1353 domain-containing protein [PVC group bacterium]|nr:DUF1353 domain-containing protein [PVC group bacterium]
MKLPQIGDTITTLRAIELCKHFKFYELSAYINRDIEKFKPWVFDGASMLPDKWFVKTSKIPNLIEIALKHDLEYAYGEHGDKVRRKEVDLKFRKNLRKDGVGPVLAEIMYRAVRFGGSEILKRSFSWGYARK